MILLDELKREIQESTFIEKPAYVLSVTEMYIKTKGPSTKIGTVFINRQTSNRYEVISSSKDENVLMPIDNDVDCQVGSFLYKYEKEQTLLNDVDTLKGMVIDCFGKPLSEALLPSKENKMKKQMSYKQREGKIQKKINPLKRKRITQKIETGIKSIDGLLTIGRGQKIGIFAGTGVGKSTLLGMIAKQSTEEVNVIALIGERGREVREFIEKELGEEGMARSVVVVATSDEPPLKQLKAAELATRIAELMRNEGKKVLLMMDSVTRYAIAKRSLDIANGEVPVMGGKTLNMERGLQVLLERSGNNEKGSITGIYTVLVENDDFEAPIPDMARGILDGHIVLTRSLANQNHFPAVDVLSSVSRVMQDVVDDTHWSLSRELKKYISLYKENEDEIKLGLIEKGVNKELDRSILLHNEINSFLRQEMKEKYNLEDTINQMIGITKRVR